MGRRDLTLAKWVLPLEGGASVHAIIVVGKFMRSREIRGMFPTDAFRDTKRQLEGYDRIWGWPAAYCVACFKTPRKKCRLKKMFQVAQWTVKGDGKVFATTFSS